MSDAAYEAYHKHAPRWVKVIQWRRLGKKAGKSLSVIGIVTSGFYMYMLKVQSRPEYFQMYLQRPQTEEELNLIRRKYKRHMTTQNWDLHHYEYGHPPLYDLWERRQKYPEYYGDRYGGDGPRFGEAVQKKEHRRMVFTLT